MPVPKRSLALFSSQNVPLGRDQIVWLSSLSMEQWHELSTFGMLPKRAGTKILSFANIHVTFSICVWKKTRKNQSNDLLSLLKFVWCLLHTQLCRSRYLRHRMPPNTAKSILVLKIYFSLLILFIYWLISHSSLLAGEYRGVGVRRTG